MAANFFQRPNETSIKLKENAATLKKKQQLDLECKIFESTNYATLDEKAQTFVYDYVQAHTSTKSHEQLEKPQDVSILRNRLTLAETTQELNERLTEINPISFRWLSDLQKTALAQELYFAFYIYSSQYQLAATEARYQSKVDFAEKIQQCARLLNLLRDSTVKHDPDGERKRMAANSEKPLKYLGATIVAPILIETIEHITAGDVITIMSYINSMRLYWVWSRGFLDTVFELLGASFGQNITSVPAPITGYMSFVLYYARGAISLGLLLKHTIAGPWMSREERNIPFWERFKSQWQQRKFAILNDWIWATANLACYFWLIGEGLLGTWGNGLTAILLLMDVSLTLWRFTEESTLHQEQLRKYERDLHELNKRISRCTDTIAYLEAELKNPHSLLKKEDIHRELPLLKEQLELLDMQNQRLLKAKQRCIHRWQDKLEGLRYDLIYSVGLLIAFCMLCGLFLPPSILPQATAAYISIAGTALCFALTVIYMSMTASLEIKSAQRQQKFATNEYQHCLGKFVELLDELKTSTDQERVEYQLKQRYLTLQQLKAKSDYQIELASWQKRRLVYSTFVNVTVPAIIFALSTLSMFFSFSLPITLGVIAGALACLWVGGRIVEASTPSQPSWQYEIQCAYTTPPSLENIHENCFYIYLEEQNKGESVIYCVGKNALGEIDTFKLEDKALGKHADEVKHLLKSNNPSSKLTSTHKKLILQAATAHGYDFSLPTFDSKKYDQFKQNARLEYRAIQKETDDKKDIHGIFNPMTLEAPSLASNTPTASPDKRQR